MCAIQPQCRLLVQVHGVSSSHSPVCKVTSHCIWRYKTLLLTLKGSRRHGNKDEILDCIVPANIACMFDGAVLISIFRPESAMTIPNMYLLRFTQKRQWTTKAGYILNKNS